MSDHPELEAVIRKLLTMPRARMADIEALADAANFAVSSRMSVHDAIAHVVAELERIVAAPELDADNLMPGEALTDGTSSTGTH